MAGKGIRGLSNGTDYIYDSDYQPIATVNASNGDTNDSEGKSQLPYSREVTVSVDTGNHVATLVSSIEQPEGLSASAQGNAQTLPDGDIVIGWGVLPYFSEFGPDGRLLFNVEFPTGVDTYRGFRRPWGDSVGAPGGH